MPSSSPAYDGAFDWRVSVADVDEDGPFSTFVGHDRILVLLSGAGMHLHFTTTGVKVSVRPSHRVARFSGSAPIDARLIDGPTTDLNLIWRRDAYVVSVHEGAAAAALPVVTPAAHAVLYLAEGELAAGPGSPPVGAGDLVIGEPGEQLTGRCTGRWVVFMLHPSSQ